MRNDQKSSAASVHVDEISAWLAAFSTEQLLSAEALPNTTTPLHCLRVVRARPAFEISPRLVVIDAMRLPGSERWAAA